MLSHEEEQEQLLLSMKKSLEGHSQNMTRIALRAAAQNPMSITSEEQSTFIKDIVTNEALRADIEGKSHDTDAIYGDELRPIDKLIDMDLDAMGLKYKDLDERTMDKIKNVLSVFHEGFQEYDYVLSRFKTLYKFASYLFTAMKEESDKWIVDKLANYIETACQLWKCFATELICAPYKAAGTDDHLYEHWDDIEPYDFNLNLADINKIRTSINEVIDDEEYYTTQYEKSEKEYEERMNKKNG